METVRGKWASFSVSTKHYFEIYVRNSFWKSFNQTLSNYFFVSGSGVVFIQIFKIQQFIDRYGREFRKLTE